MSMVVYQGSINENEDITIRYPRSEDLPELLEYINKLSREKTFTPFQGEEITQEQEEKYLKNQLRNIEGKKSIMLLAFDKDKLIGNAGIHLKDGIENHVGTFGITLSIEYRNKGIGKKLAETVINEAIEKLPDLKIINLWVFEKNTVAISLYDKLGFREYGRLHEGILYNNEYIDRIEMAMYIK